MSKEDLLELTGKVIDVLPNSTFKVELETGSTIIAYTNGRIRQNKIRIITGDSVKVEISVYDLSKGRITFRM